MGIVGFQWGDNQLTLLMNRDNWESRVINEADWFGGVLGGRCEETNGTWFGVTQEGRVAFLVDSALVMNMVDENGRPETIPIEFLQLLSDLSPDMFAAQLVEDEQAFHSGLDDDDDDDDDEITGRAYNLIVADIIAGSMVYISKSSEVDAHVNTESVAFGVHTLSLDGLDSFSPKDLRLRNLFNEMIGEYENQELPELYELAERFMYDTTEAVPGDDMTALFVDKISYPQHDCEADEEHYGTTSTTVFVVDHTNQAKFYESYFEDGMLNDNDFTFNIA